jgi:hypothetical protein
MSERTGDPKEHGAAVLKRKPGFEGERAMSSGRVLNRREALAAGGIGALGAALALAGIRPVLADDENRDDTILGAWHVTVHVDGVVKPFDVLYAFGLGGIFVRVDGRSNAFPTALGTWRHHGDVVEFNYVLFAFDATGARTGTITVPSSGRVADGTLTGTFTAYGVDVTGSPLPGFPKTGTVEGVQVSPTQ